MERPFRLVMLSVAAAGVLILASTPTLAWPQTVPVKKVEAPVHAISPEVLRKLTAPTPREVILESIKTLQHPAGTAVPPIKLQMRQGQGKGKPSASASAAGAAHTAGMSTGYEKIDWKAGVFVSPFTVPRYGTGNWPAAMVRTNYVNYMKTQDPGIVVLDWPVTSYGSYSLYDTIDVELELPQEAGLYTIALKIARVDGTCDERWFRDRTKCGSYPLSVLLAGQSVPMTKLIDDSGFVGVINIEPGEAHDGSPYGMRQYNATLMVDVTAWGGVQDEPMPKVGPLVFAGIVITRL
jgi:hypothetical protein